jgi:hypothetical protein
MATTITKTRAANTRPYSPTAVDAAKADADFRLVDVSFKNAIVWRNGTMEFVTDAKLAKLQAAHSWAVDF